MNSSESGFRGFGHLKARWQIFKRWWKQSIITLAAKLTGYQELYPVIKCGEVDSNHFVRQEERDPDKLEEKEGWDRYWGDAAVNKDYFEILRNQSDQGCRFRILCPTFLRRPVEIYCEDPDAWGGY